MPRITFIDPNGVAHVVDAAKGQSVMQAGVTHRVPGMVSECGGSGACASCHAYVDQAWTDRLSLPQRHEADMLTCVLRQRSNSRLTCQIKMTPDLDGLVIYLTDNAF